MSRTVIPPTRLDAESVLVRELGGSERLLWSGRPRQGLMLRPSDAFMIPFSLMWGGFVIFWEYKAISGGAPLSMALFGLPFVAMGLHMIVGRFVTDANARKHTYYGVTDQRIVMVSGKFRRRVKTLNLRTLSDISLEEGPGGTGTITLGPQNPLAWWSQGTSMAGTGVEATPSFERIENAKAVYEIIRSAQESVVRSSRA